MEAKDIEKHKQELLQIGIIVNDFGTEFSLCVDDKKRPLPDICKVTEKIFEISFKAGIKEVVDNMRLACVNGSTEWQKLTNLIDVLKYYENKLKEWGVK